MRPPAGGLVDGPTTELGVMSHRDEDEEAAPHPRSRLGDVSSSAAAARFTLSDEDEHEHPAPLQRSSSGGGRGPQRQPTINVDAAQQGVLVESLPTPITPAPLAPPPPQ